MGRRFIPGNVFSPAAASHDPASALCLSQSATGMEMEFPMLTGKTYRLEYTDDLSSNQWRPLTEAIPGDDRSVLVRWQTDTCFPGWVPTQTRMTRRHYFLSFVDLVGADNE